MGDVGKIGTQIASFITAILGVAIIAVILSQGANTVNVITSFFSGLTSLLAVVVSPVTGGSNFATGSSTYAGETTLGSGAAASSSAAGSLGLSVNGLGSLAVSGSALNSLIGSGSSSSSGVDSGTWDTGGDVSDLATDLGTWD